VQLAAWLKPCPFKAMGDLDGLLGFGFGAFLSLFVFVESEVVTLFAEEALGLVGEIFAGFDGIFAGEVEGLFAGERFEGGEPVLRFVGQDFQRSTDIGVAIGIFVEIGADLVHQVRDILQFAVEVLGARIGCAAIGKAFDDVDVVVEELGVELHALVGIDTGFADFLNLRFGEGIVVLPLRDDRWGNEQSRDRKGQCGKGREAGTHGRNTLHFIQTQECAGREAARAEWGRGSMMRAKRGTAYLRKT
jgi:hypothetical protein